MLVLCFALALAHLLPRPVRTVRFPKPGKLELWYWQHTDLVSDEAVGSAEALSDKAERFGYTGVAFWDSSFNRLGDPLWPAANVTRLQHVLHHASERGLRVMALGAPFGWSNAALIPDGNLVESQRVIGSRFQVDASGTRLNFVNSFAPLRNAGFENGKNDWFDTRDSGIGLSGDISHSGRHSGVIAEASANARFRQEIKLTPWRQYHLALWVRSQTFHGAANVEVVDWWHRKRAIFYAPLLAQGTKEWTRYDFAFNSRDTAAAYLYFGVWGKSSGVIWFDDVTLEETALVYVVRREGSPLRVYDPKRGADYREGKDYRRVFDPVLSPPRSIFRDSYHPPVTVTLPPGSALRPGETVAIDFYAAFPMPGSNQVGMCLTNSGVFTWLRNNANALGSIMPPGSFLLLSYDEMRQVNSCALCRGRHLSAGELLAENVVRTTNMYERLLPKTQLYVWSDMFDPAHNAVPHYFYVEGSLAGSWKGLRPEVGVLNWNHAHLAQSLRWFSGLNSRQTTPHRQLIAGYYDGGNGAAISEDLNLAHEIPGIEGVMYVSWKDDYSQLKEFADSAKEAWSSYADSVSGTSPSDFR